MILGKCIHIEYIKMILGTCIHIEYNTLRKEYNLLLCKKIVFVTLTKDFFTKGNPLLQFEKRFLISVIWSYYRRKK